MIKDNDIVVHSNALSRARWAVESVWEPRLVALLASKIRTEDEDFKKYAIHISEVFHGREYGSVNYTEVEKTVDKVMSRIITIRDDKGWNKYTVFSGCSFDSESNTLHIGFHPDLKPHYLNLQNQFVKYSLIEFLKLPSIYSQRLYQFLKSWNDKPEIEIPIIDLHEMLNAPQSLRANFKDFRRCALDKAYKDIHEITKLKYEWEPIKTGRKVTVIRFIFTKKKSLPAGNKNNNKIQKYTSKKNNKNFELALTCAKEKNICSKENNKKTICSVCKEFKMTKYK